MPEMNDARWQYTCRYLAEVFGQPDEHLATLMEEAVREGLPDISITADVGRLLKMLVEMSGAVTALEIGTLAGYSGIWLARGLRREGRQAGRGQGREEARLITIEAEPKHAAFARRQFDRAGVGDIVQIVEGEALAVLPGLLAEMPAGALDVVFADAVKREYPAYWDLVRPKIAIGGLFIMDNALGSGAWWIDEAGHADRDAVDALNRELAADPDFEAVGIPIREGLTVARRVS